MPITVARLPDEPILIATFMGYITVDDIREMYQTVAALVADEPGDFYRISDVSAGETNFLEMTKIVQTATQDLPASSMDERIHVTYVGNSSWINFARDVFLKRGIMMAAFENMDMALESVRWQIKQGKEAQSHEEADSQEAVNNS